MLRLATAPARFLARLVARHGLKTFQPMLKSLTTEPSRKVIWPVSTARNGPSSAIWSELTEIARGVICLLQPAARDGEARSASAI
jgi:hypothetical protein